MNITKIQVLLCNGTDEVHVYTDLPCPFTKAGLPSQPNLTLNFKATFNTGIEYCRRVFKIEPEIVSLRTV